MTPPTKAVPVGNVVVSGAARRSLRIVLYSWPFHPMVGGLERLTEMTARHLQAAGHAVTVATEAPDPERKTPYLPYNVVRRPGLGRLYRLIRGADVVHLNTFSVRVMLLALAARRPMTWQHIDFDTLTPRGICHAYGAPCVFKLTRCYECLRRDHSRLGTARSIASLFLKRFAVHAVSVNLLSTRYASKRMRLPRARFLSFGIDTQRFTPPSQRPDGPLRVFFVARHVPGKGCDVLVRALARAKASGVLFQARIAGDGPHREASERLTAALGLTTDVRFIGLQSPDRLLEELRTADVVPIPTVQDEIGQYVVFEAMACECTVVASNIGALPEHVADAGLLFPPGDDAALAACMGRLDADRVQLRRLGRLGRQRVLSEFDADATGQRYEELFREVSRGSIKKEHT